MGVELGGRDNRRAPNRDDAWVAGWLMVICAAVVVAWVIVGVVRSVDERSENNAPIKPTPTSWTTDDGDNVVIYPREK